MDQRLPYGGYEDLFLKRTGMLCPPEEGTGKVHEDPAGEEIVSALTTMVMKRFR
jgi:hypothetical protein